MWSVQHCYSHPHSYLFCSFQTYICSEMRMIVQKWQEVFCPSPKEQQWSCQLWPQDTRRGWPHQRLCHWLQENHAFPSRTCSSAHRKQWEHSRCTSLDAESKLSVSSQQHAPNESLPAAASAEQTCCLMLLSGRKPMQWRETFKATLKEKKDMKTCLHHSRLLYIFLSYWNLISVC